MSKLLMVTALSAGFLAGIENASARINLGSAKPVTKQASFSWGGSNPFDPRDSELPDNDDDSNSSPADYEEEES